MNFFETFVSREAIELVGDCMRSGRLSAGKLAEEFERLLYSHLRIENPVTVNSGTSALHLALVLAGVKPGDEVILPAQTFIATGMAILYVGAIPVFCDINPFDGCIDVNDLRTKLSNKTRAIMCVDWAGYPCDLDVIMEFGKTYGIPVIEDAAHSIGAIYKNRPVGCIADFTCFSFQAIKHLTTGDGGAICCKKLSDTTIAKDLRWFNISRERSTAGLLGERLYDAQSVGYKYHLNDFAASMGIGNLPHLRKNLIRVDDIAQVYDSAFKDIKELSLMDYKLDRSSSYWLYPILIQRRDDFVKKMKALDIPVSVVHLGIDKNSVFGGVKKELKGQRFFDANQIHLPINYNLTNDEVARVVEAVKGGW